MLFPFSSSSSFFSPAIMVNCRWLFCFSLFSEACSLFHATRIMKNVRDNTMCTLHFRRSSGAGPLLPTHRLVDKTGKKMHSKSPGFPDCFTASSRSIQTSIGFRAVIAIPPSFKCPHVRWVCLWRRRSSLDPPYTCTVTVLRVD